MADLSVKFIADKLGKDLESAADRVKKELEAAVKNLAHAAHANIIAKVQASKMSQQNKTNYMKSVQFLELGDNSFLISLEGAWPNKLEAGFGPYSIKDMLLKSKKIVQVGSRAGQPWVRQSKEGKKYAAVPMQHHPSAAAPGDLDAEIKKMYAFNRQGVRQKITKTFTDDLGRPIAGKVASVVGEGISPNLQNLTKYQHIHESGKVSSLYMTYRIVHEDSSGWMHPGSSGMHFFKEAEREIEKELENIIKILL
jgi:hypothetical protein